LPVALDAVCRSARERLAALKPSHRPRDPKLTFVRELTQAWACRTGEKPGISGDATWEEPISRFGRFVKIAACMLPSTVEFRKGGVPLRCQNLPNKSEIPALQIKSNK
jgi:hypothetical protein